jgi:hypothetical protein
MLPKTQPLLKPLLNAKTIKKMNFINKIFPILLTALLLTAFDSCKKKPEGVQEQSLQIRLDPPATAPVRTSSTTYAFKVFVESTMPERGIDLDVTYKKDTDQSIIFNQRYTATSAASPVDVTITGIPFNEMGTVTVTATSKSTATNTTSKTFSLARK